MKLTFPPKKSQIKSIVVGVMLGSFTTFLNIGFLTVCFRENSSQIWCYFSVILNYLFMFVPAWTIGQLLPSSFAILAAPVLFWAIVFYIINIVIYRRKIKAQT